MAAVSAMRAAVKAKADQIISRPFAAQKASAASRRAFSMAPTLSSTALQNW